MVLATWPGGVVGAGRTPVPRAPADGRGEAGSQVLEFAMVLPLFGLLLAVLAQTALLLADVLVAQGIAREVARSAAVDGEAQAQQLADELAGDRDLRVDLDRDGDLVEVRAELHTRAFAAAGADAWVPARATFRVEAGEVGVGDG